MELTQEELKALEVHVANAVAYMNADADLRQIVKESEGASITVKEVVDIALKLKEFTVKHPQVIDLGAFLMNMGGSFTTRALFLAYYALESVKPAAPVKVDVSTPEVG